MTTFDERENTFEAKFAHDEEMQFKARARANKLTGLWAAELLGKTGDAAEAYAMEIVKSDFEEAGIDDVVRRLRADLGDKASEEEIRTRLSENLAVAKEQLMNEV